MFALPLKLKRVFGKERWSERKSRDVQNEGKVGMFRKERKGGDVQEGKVSMFKRKERWGCSGRKGRDVQEGNAGMYRKEWIGMGV
jgi:hypothetical protein